LRRCDSLLLLFFFVIVLITVVVIEVIFEFFEKICTLFLTVIGILSVKQNAFISLIIVLK
jgi:hypothetical protein